MTVYRRGSAGPEVKLLQERLGELGFYRGSADGIFGGGTESAVRAFQRDNRRHEDGLVGAETWRAITGTEIPIPAIVKEDLELRCLALTAAFETGAPPPECFAIVTGDFDGMGISFGALQWNIGTGTLQALIKDLESQAPALIDDVFHQHASELRAAINGPIPDALAWARTIQNLVTHVLSEPWRGLFKTLGRTPECRAAQGRGAGARFQRGLAMCDSYGLWSERAAALMFDVVVQNGSISAVVDQQIRSDIAALGSLAPNELEVRKMEIVAIRRSAQSEALVG